MLERIRVVLVRPQRGGNVGAAARAMKNMGLSDLVLVAPRTRVGVTATRMAAHAGDLLAARRTVGDVSRAVADCSLVVGTTCRLGGYRDGALELRGAVPEIVAAARRGRVAVLFGPEDHGLSNADLRSCQRLVTIPTSLDYASLNLAQAVLLCAYEIALHQEAQPGARARAGSGARTGAGARARSGVRARSELRSADTAVVGGAEREQLLTHFSQALDAIGFLSAQNPEHILHDVRSLFDRAGLRARDVRVWRGIARQILWAATRGAKAPRGRSRRAT